MDLGLANFVVPPDALMESAIGLAIRLAQQPQQSVEETKRAINLHVQAAIQRVAPFAFAAESESFTTEDLRQAVDKFKGKD